MPRITQRRFALAVAVLSLAAALGAQTPQWKSYSYPADGFSVAFPSEPQMKSRSIPSDAGSVELRTYLANDDPGGMMIAVCDLGAAIADKDPDTLMQDTVIEVHQSSDAHLLSEKKVTLGVYHGIAFEAESDVRHITGRIYLVGTTLYQVLVAYPIGKPYADTTRFLDSFQLIARIGK
ncbi:MAG TPA: hypothetical protein VGE85_14285 [Terracidiphilus sp.]|jgi:hypothetical protein